MILSVSVRAAIAFLVVLYVFKFQLFLV